MLAPDFPTEEEADFSPEFHMRTLHRMFACKHCGQLCNWAETANSFRPQEVETGKYHDCLNPPVTADSFDFL